MILFAAPAISFDLQGTSNHPNSISIHKANKKVAIEYYWCPLKMNNRPNTCPQCL